MRLPTVLRYLLVVLTVGCASGTALAQTPSRVRDGEYWEVITTAQGCHAILSDELEMHWGPDPNVRFSWNGGCDASGLITGSGTLITAFRASRGARIRTEMSGVATQGLFAGRVERATYSDDDDFNPNTPPGAMVLLDLGVANPMAFLYKRGCSYFIDSNGATEPEPDFSGCNGNDGIAFWKKTLAEGVPNGSLAVKPPAPQPATTPQAAAGDDAFQSNLKTFEANQLFAMANDLVQRGEFDMAKLARNALLARFPDSPLVTTIVQLLASTAQPAAQASADLAQAVSQADAAYARADYAEAVRWFRLAADQGNAVAQNNLGLMYDNGQGVPENDAEAVRWYRLAADQGLAEAQSVLGSMYAKGEGVLENDVEAVRWFRLAADQGLAESQHNLGNMYVEGKGVPQNDAEAVGWFRLAADQGLAAAQNNLGVMYSNGRGVPENDVEAYKWWSLAAAQGNADAFSNRGNAYNDQRDYARAIADYDQAIGLQPNNAELLNSRCWARAVWGQQLDQALSDCDASLRIANEPNTLDSRGLVHLRRSEFQAAFADYDAAVRANLIGSLYGRGIARLRLGQIAEGQADIVAATGRDANIAARFATYGVTP